MLAPLTNKSPPGLPPEPAPASSALQTQPAAWLAELKLAFSSEAGRTVLRHRHQGPLRIQKALYPDGPHCCHAIVVHPPGGIAAGDQLTIEINVDQAAHALVATPAASKWYGSWAGQQARQTVSMNLQGRIEWLPAETIVFDGACAQSVIDIKAGPHASMIGWDQVVFGRQASGERFLDGCFDQTLRVQIDQQCVWVDRLRLRGCDPLFDSPIGLNGFHALATWWAIAPAQDPWSDETLESLRQGAPELAFTRLHPRLLVARMLGPAIELSSPLVRAWSVLKQSNWGLEAQPLRLWAT